MCASVERWTAGARRRYGFTLVEMLVTTAIAAVLFSLIAQTLGRARDQTRLTLCRSHLRNVGVGATLYATDNRSYLPVVPKLDNPHTELIAALSPRHYVEDPRCYYCPSMSRPEMRFSEENLAAGSISYFYFSCRQATPNYRVSTFLRWEVRWPRLLRDHMDWRNWVISDAWFSGEPTAHRYKKKGVNYFILGGTVEMIDRSPRRDFR